MRFDQQNLNSSCSQPRHHSGPPALRVLMRVLGLAHTHTPRSKWPMTSGPVVGV